MVIDEADGFGHRRRWELNGKSRLPDRVHFLTALREGRLDTYCATVFDLRLSPSDTGY